MCGMPLRVPSGCLLKDWSATEQYNINSTIQYLLHNKENTFENCIIDFCIKLYKICLHILSFYFLV